MKKTFVTKTILAVLALSLTLGGCQNGKSAEEGGVAVQQVESIVGPATGLYDQYAGLIVSKDTVQVEKDENKTVKEIAVKEGDIVSVGDKLFSYDVEALNLSIEQAKLEKEQIENSISSMNDQITQLKNQSAYAGSSEQLEYTLQIQKLETDVREAQYNLQQKGKELEKLEQSVNHVDVTAPCDGRIQSINEGGTDSMGNPAAFITILELGTYRVKGTINELNVQSLSEGMPVIIRSRVDSSVTWAGSVESIDWENPVKDDSSMYYMGSSDEMTSSSKYPFYITLDTTDGLMLGQHVYIEPDMGQNEQKEGLWLPSWYIVDPEGDPYVWAASKKDKLEKRKLILGKYDADTDTWQIQGGLETSDFIAFPDDTLEEGAAVSYFDETMLPEGNLDAGMDTDLGGATFDGAAIPEGGDAMAVPAA